MHTPNRNLLLFKCLVVTLSLFLLINNSQGQKFEKDKQAHTYTFIDSSLNKLYKNIGKCSNLKRQSTLILKDSDGDGIMDQFDLEPNTPAGAEVDTHGKAVDTDGDGVPDYKDKEKVTLQQCFPADSNGIGICPEPLCCRDLRLEYRNNSGAQFDSLICSLPLFASLPADVLNYYSKKEINVMFDEITTKLTNIESPFIQIKFRSSTNIAKFQQEMFIINLLIARIIKDTKIPLSNIDVNQVEINESANQVDIILLRLKPI